MIKMLNLLLILLLAGLSGYSHITKEKKNQSSSRTDSLTIENIFPLQLQHCHGSSIVELPNKDLLVAWFQGSGERTADDVAIKGSRYNHKTRQWSEPFIMADVPEFPDINPVLFIDGKSRLWLIWYTVMAYQWQSSLLKYRISDNDIEEGRYRLSVWLSQDEGKTWSQRKILINGMPGSDVRGHYPAIIQGADGIIHISFTNQTAGKDGQPSIKNIVHACFSENWLMK